MSHHGGRRRGFDFRGARAWALVWGDGIGGVTTGAGSGATGTRIAATPGGGALRTSRLCEICPLLVSRWVSSFGRYSGTARFKVHDDARQKRHLARPRREDQETKTPERDRSPRPPAPRAIRLPVTGSRHWGSRFISPVFSPLLLTNFHSPHSTFAPPTASAIQSFQDRKCQLQRRQRLPTRHPWSHPFAHGIHKSFQIQDVTVRSWLQAGP